jgi:hypothetical protein
MAIEAIRDVVIEFCKRTKALRVDADAFYTIIGVTSYTLSPPVDTQIIDVLSLKYNNNRQILPTMREELDRANPNWETLEGSPNAFLSTRPGEIVLDRIPLEAIIVKPFVAVKPSQSSLGVEDFIFEEFKADIKNGVLAFLFAQPNKAYSNPALAAYYSQLFERNVWTATSKAQSGYNGKKQFTCKSHFF